VTLRLKGTQEDFLSLNLMQTSEKCQFSGLIWRKIGEGLLSVAEETFVPGRENVVLGWRTTQPRTLQFTHFTQVWLTGRHRCGSRSDLTEFVVQWWRL
jgi:hypothetical protein